MNSFYKLLKHASSTILKGVKFLAFWIFPFSLFAQSNPINLVLQKVSAGKYQFQVVLQKGFALQKEAPNKIQLTAEDGLQIKQFKSEFKGKVFFDKPEYFETVEPIPLEVYGKGSLQIEAKFFYCDLNKGVCYPAKFSKQEKIQ